MKNKNIIILGLIGIIGVLGFKNYQSNEREEPKEESRPKKENPTQKEDNSLVYSYSSNRYDELKRNKNKSYQIDTIFEVEKKSFHSFDLQKKIITLVIINYQNENTLTLPFKIDEYNIPKKIIDGSSTVFNLNEPYFKKVTIRKDGNIIYTLEDGAEIIYKGIRKIDNKILDKYKTNQIPEPNNNKSKEPTSGEFESSEHWRKEAYDVALQYVQKAINKKENCKVIRQGIYQPYLLKNIGNFGYLVKTYCEFDCNQNYLNPANIWVEVYYQGNNTWKGEIIKQKLTH
ncbi:hypothetical protein [Flavicella sediminum]|uniref:hypothetical protein n=1 Tax=Flavicella sediminum TaxID=2585141 RepID=UPI001120B829|nr:hypothetical protein [Flavicella sediminum]